MHREIAEFERGRSGASPDLVLEWWVRNRVRNQGVDVKSLTEAELAQADPEPHPRLRELGHL